MGRKRVARLMRAAGLRGATLRRYIVTTQPDLQAQRDIGKGDGGLTTAEREELSRLRRENRKLKEEREILSKAAAWFATESGTSKRSSGS